ncbi:MAG: iron uptake porin [Cyanobacteria bacterium CRU_2_1]|nr:iron uptake porin [Cyanobacteria bacterium RU_5_0]NJR60410.1 iron uptake porin [Cyanobacteria bacterium CRU_2_1]
MSKILWNSLLATPALLGAALVVSASAIAAEPITDAEALLGDSTTPDIESAEVSSSPTELLPSQVSTALTEAPTVEVAAPTVEIAAPETTTETESVSAPITADVAPEVQAPIQLAQQVPAEQPGDPNAGTSIDEIIDYSNGESLDQVTSISQLSDVRPEDWAFQALQSLIERYGCIAGYPDGTYRGQSAMTRYEFAAGLNACLDRISELIAASTADLATKEDLATLQRLQEEFAAELATLRGRVDNLEARVAELEENQFSTTTKLRGETIFSVGVPIGQDDELFNDQVIGGYRIRLNFDTSFTGEDLLRARLQARDFSDFESFGGLTEWQWGGQSDDIVLDDLLYTFPLGDQVQVIIGANSIGDSDFVASTVSPFDSSGSGSITNFGTPPQYNFAIPAGTGAGAIIQLTDNFSFDFGYASSEAGDPSEGAGLFNGDYGLIAQLTFLSDAFDAALMYANGYDSDGFDYGVGVSPTGIDADGDDDGLPQVVNTYGAQINFKISEGFQIGAGVMYAPVRTLNRGDYDVWSYQATIAFPDLGGEGNLLGIVAGAPPYAAGVGDGLFGEDDGLDFRSQRTSIIVEGFYRLRINDNISITPGITYIADPGHDEGADDTFVGAIRTTFRF